MVHHPVRPRPLSSPPRTGVNLNPRQLQLPGPHRHHLLPQLLHPAPAELVHLGSGSLPRTMVLNNGKTSSVGEWAARINVDSDLVNGLWYMATPPLSTGCAWNSKSSSTAVNFAFFPLFHSTWTMRFVVMADKNLRSRDDIIATSPLRICPRVFFSPRYGGAVLKKRSNVRSKVFIWGYVRHLDPRQLNMASRGSST